MALIEELSFELLEDRYSRQRLAACWDQEKVSKANILVAGAGALGNEVLKNLALIGAGHILIIDFDRVEISNLSRSVLFREEDIGRPKASTAAHALRRMNPEIHVEAIDGDLETDLGLGQIRDCDLVLGCLDSVYARWALNRACWRAGRPWINAGINATVGEICLHVPGQGPCYECGMTQQMWQQIHHRRSCMLLPKNLPARAVPGTAVIASLTAALQVNEALAWLHRETPHGETPHEETLHGETLRREKSNTEKHLSPGEMLLLLLHPYSLSSFMTSAKSDCLAHDTYLPSVFIQAGPTEITTAELLRRFPGALSLQMDFDILESWLCSNCGEEPVGKRLLASSGAQVSCPNCRAQRKPQLIHEINCSHWLAEHSLAALGVPPRAILRVISSSGIHYVELTANTDREIKWPPSPSKS
jgi:adenylyltransferase/sulfurtransferase